ncbi:MAG: fasciclin domain-containing protein [Longimicrobiales bacterium]|nr:fasciclin domain-containing protein [Longimicrobiales bacterium]
MFNFKMSRLGGVLLAAAVTVGCSDDDVTEPVELDTIAATAAASSDLSTLSAALEAAGLVSTLEGAGPFTVFAPRNAAFDALGADVVAQLLEDGNIDLLSRVLTFHVVAGAAVSSGELSDGQTFTTVEGGELTVGVSGGSVTVNGANVVTGDVEASNGVVHIVDDVLVPSDTDVYETAVLTQGTTTLASAVLAAGLDGALQGEGPFTVFAPVNSAFADLDAFTLQQLLAEGNGDILAKVLTFHVVAGPEVFAADLTDGQTVESLQGQQLTFDLSDAADPKVNGVSITTTDIEVENGVIHLVDEVIIPEFNVVETAILTESTQTLAAAVAATDLAEALSDPAGTGEAPFTVFVPVDAAFEALGTDRLDVILDPANQALLQKILTYHVIPGAIVEAGDLTDGQTATTLAGAEVTFDLSDAADPKINGTSIIATDIPAENGVIHLIDGVLTENLDIVDVATLEGFSTLVSLVDQQDLTATLRGDNMGDGYTVFAPTNDAFDALTTVPSGDDLTNVLLYHVVPATVESGALTDGQVVGTAYSGHDFTVNIDGSVTITDESGNTVNVILTDVMAANGIIHVIDAVLIPTP